MYNLPYGRALCELQLLYCSVLLDLYHIHVNTEKRHTEVQRRKPSLVQVIVLPLFLNPNRSSACCILFCLQFVEDFQKIEETPEPFEDDEDLATVMKSVPHRVQSVLQEVIVATQQLTGSTFRAKVRFRSETGS